jgi:hypothetical protein
VDQLQLVAAKADRPHAIHLMPEPLMAKQPERTISGRTLQVIQPVARPLEGRDFAGGQISREEPHAPGLTRAASAATRRPVADRAEGERFIGVDAVETRPRRQLGQISRYSGVDVGRTNHRALTTPRGVNAKAC